MARIIIDVADGLLTLATTPMTAAEINLWLDMAKSQLLNQGRPDAIIQDEEGESAEVKVESVFGELTMIDAGD